MKLEIPVGYRLGEIANTASVLVDELVKTEIPGTNTWHLLKDSWIMHIRGKNPDESDLTAIGLRLSYKGILENLKNRQFPGIEALLEEPRIVVSADEELLSPPQIVGVATTLRYVSSEYYLREDLLPPTSLVFSKGEYATEVVVWDSKKFGLS